MGSRHSSARRGGRRPGRSMAAITAGTALLATAALVASPLAQAQAPDAPADGGVATIIAWNDIALGAAVGTAKQSPPHAFATMALVQAAVYDAVVAIEGGYQPYLAGLDATPGGSVDAAVAAAAHGVLAHYLPDQRADLDAAYESAIAAIADGDAKTSGVTVGTAAAAALIAARDGDGYGGPSDFTMPEPAPGTWQIPAEQTPITPWLADLRPFLMETPDQFRPAPPPALDGPEWAADLNEVRAVGGAESATRTPEQALIAQFWAAHPAPQAYQGLQQVALDHGLDASATARLFAMAGLVAADSLIACFDAKYEYLLWRPSTAVPGAADDGNDATAADAAWVPLIGTPPHPEYPSAHSCATPAAAHVIADVLGTDQIDVTFASSVTADTMPTRHYATVADLSQEVMDARIWGGIHYRFSTVVGEQIGRQVHDLALERHFQPIP